MKIEHMRWQSNWWEPTVPGKLRAAQLVLLFGCPSLLKQRYLLQEIQQVYPNAHLLGCSTAGEISDTRVLDDSLVATAIQFERTALHGVRVKLKKGISDFKAGELLAQELDKAELVHVFVLSHGVNVNGSALVAGLTRHLPPHVTLTGGLSGDGTRFQETLVVWEGKPEVESIVVLGFYSKRLHVGYGSLGGWDTFGPKRLITRSAGNVQIAQPNDGDHDLLREVSIHPGLGRTLPTTMRKLLSPFPFTPRVHHRIRFLHDWACESCSSV